MGAYGWKYYGLNDWSNEKSRGEVTNYIKEINLQKEFNFSDINQLLELYNVLNYVRDLFRNDGDLNDEYKSFSKKSHTAMSKLVFNHERELFNEFNNIDRLYRQDFWPMVNEYANLKNIEEVWLEALLDQHPAEIRALLSWKYTAKNFKDVLRDKFVQNPMNVELIVDELDSRLIKNPIPEIDNVSFNEMVSSYLEDSNAKFVYLEKLKRWKKQGELYLDLPVLNKLYKKVNELETQYLTEGYQVSYEFSVTPFENKPKDFVGIKRNGSNMSIKVNENVLNQLTTGQDYLEFLRNWPFFFSVYETFSVIKPVDKTGMAFYWIQKHFDDEYDLDNLSFLAAIISLQGLEAFRVRHEQSSLVEAIEEFIDGLEEDYKVSGFDVQLSSRDSSYYTRLKIILPEVEKLITHFEVFRILGRSGEQELKQIGLNKKGFQSAKSFFPVKFYEPFDWSFLNGLFKQRKNYETNEKWTIVEKLFLDSAQNNEDDFETIIKELVEHKLLNEKTKESLLTTTDLVLLKKIWINGYITFASLSIKERESAEKLVHINLLVENNNVFSREEVKFISFMLDDKKYSNGQSIRNSVLHGTFSSNNHNESQTAYFQVLMVLILIVVRLKDEFQYFDESQA